MACKGYEKREARRKEVDRITAGILANVHRKEGSAFVPFEKLYPLVTDGEVKKDLMNKEEYEKVLKQSGRKIPTQEDRETLLNRAKWRNKSLKRNSF